MPFRIQVQTLLACLLAISFVDVLLCLMSDSSAVLIASWWPRQSWCLLATTFDEWNLFCACCAIVMLQANRLQLSSFVACKLAGHALPRRKRLDPCNKSITHSTLVLQGAEVDSKLIMAIRADVLFDTIRLIYRIARDKMHDPRNDLPTRLVA